MFKRVVIFFLYFQFSLCWDFYCLFKKCDEDNASEPPKPAPFNFLKYNPYCLAFTCGEDEPSENTKSDSKSNWSPSCWFKDCSENEEIDQKQFPKFWKYNYWFKNKGDSSKPWKDKFYCIFKDCPEEEIEEQKVEQGHFFQGMYKSAINYLNAAKPQDFVVNNMLTSEISPYCWFTECCNDNSIPGNIEELSKLIKTKLYGQHLANTVTDAVGSHWDSRQTSKKALVLSFHGPVGTGKTYLSQMIANSLFKLGANSKYVHHFSGRLHFTTQANADLYKQNLYSWLKGNVTTCGKQLFIFNEADHMPEQVLNSILPMLDYREKVDGADYRNSIFMFLSNAGSDLILAKLDELYHNNKTRAEVEIEDFEKVIVQDIFNEQGGFYHSDTISHNLIDHYIPFLPLERDHVIECIKDQFRERNINSPSEEHVGSILNSITWNHVDNFEYSTSGCKIVGSKVSILYEKYYKSTKDSKSDL